MVTRRDDGALEQGDNSQRGTSNGFQRCEIQEVKLRDGDEEEGD